MTPDTLARLQAPLHHLIPHSLLLGFRQLRQRRLLRLVLREWSALLPQPSFIFRFQRSLKVPADEPG